jgi:hypothetical protein
LSAPHSALKRPPQPRKLLITEIRSLEEKTIEGAEMLFGFRRHILGAGRTGTSELFRE